MALFFAIAESEALLTIATAKKKKKARKKKKEQRKNHEFRRSVSVV
jgi:hypothetical protein